MIEKNYYLNRSAKEAYRSYLLAYASHSLKHIFNVHSLDLVNVAKGFGFGIPPRVNLNISATGGGDEGKTGKRRHAAGEGLGDKKAMIAQRIGSGHNFSASNPYGKRADGDKRQFTR